MFDRRDFLRATGGALGAGLVTGTASASHSIDPVENYHFLGEAPVPGIEELVVQGDWAYCADGGALATVDLNDPTLPTTAGRTRGDHDGDSADAKVAGDIASITHNSGNGGISLFDVSDPENPVYEGFYNAASHVHNHFLKEAPDGRTYAYLTITDSFAYSRLVIVDVTDPSNPVTLEGPESAKEGPDVPDEKRGTNGSWMLRDARPDMAKSNLNPLHDIWVAETDAGNELAYLCYWDAGVVVVDVTRKERPVAVGHFGAVEYADAQYGTVEYYQQYIGGGGTSNAHYVQPTPDLGYTFIGAETFPGPSMSGVFEPLGDHGGIRVFDTSSPDIAPVAEGGTAIYPEVDGVADDPDIATDPIDEGDPVQHSPDRPNPDNAADWVAYIEAPDPIDDAAVTSHNFDVTEDTLHASWYQGGVRAYDLTTLYQGGDYEVHAEDPSEPIEIGRFAPEGMAFWTAEHLVDEDGDSVYTVGSDIGKGAVVLELRR